MHFRVLAKALRMSGGDHIHAGTTDVTVTFNHTNFTLKFYLYCCNYP